MPFRNLHFKHILYCCFLNFFHTSLSMLLLHHMYCILSWNHIDLAQENHLPLLGDATSKSSAKLLRHEGLNWLSWNPHIPWSLASFLLEWQQIPWPVNLYVHVWADLKQLILAHASCCVQNFGWYTINTCWYQLLPILQFTECFLKSSYNTSGPTLSLPTLFGFISSLAGLLALLHTDLQCIPSTYIPST